MNYCNLHGSFNAQTAIGGCPMCFTQVQVSQEPAPWTLADALRHMQTITADRDAQRARADAAETLAKANEFRMNNAWEQTKRAHEEADEARKALAAVKKEHDDWLTHASAAIAERDDLRARLQGRTLERDEARASLENLGKALTGAEAKLAAAEEAVKAGPYLSTPWVKNHAAVLAERDAALARVRELEEQLDDAKCGDLTDRVCVERDMALARVRELEDHQTRALAQHMKHEARVAELTKLLEANGIVVPP